MHYYCQSSFYFAQSPIHFSVTNQLIEIKMQKLAISRADDNFRVNQCLFQASRDYSIVHLSQKTQIL